jgi:Ulp1 family protease
VFDSLEETSAEYLDDICAPVSYALNKICEGKLFSYKKANFPCQENEDDCGVFMLLGLRSLALALPTRFSQMDIA